MRAATVGVAVGVAAVLAWAALHRPAPSPSPLVGRPMPSLALRDGQGRPVALDWPGQVSVVNIWASWCGPCVKEMPSLQVLHRELGDEGLRVVGLSVDDDPADGRRTAEALEVGYRLVYDPGGRATLEPLGIEGVPTTIVVGRDGRITDVLAGIADYGSPEAVGHFRDLLRR